MPYIEHEISEREFLDECDDHDLAKIVKHLREQKLLTNRESMTDYIDQEFPTPKLSVGQSEIFEALRTIARNTLRLEPEDENNIQEIANRF